MSQLKEVNQALKLIKELTKADDRVMPIIRAQLNMVYLKGGIDTIKKSKQQNEQKRNQKQN